VWTLAQNLGVGHRSLVTHEMVLSEYNEDLIIFDIFCHERKKQKQKKTVFLSASRQ